MKNYFLYFFFDHCQNEESNNELQERAAVIPPPKDASSYGEMGKPVLLNVTIILLIISTNMFIIITIN